MPDPTDPSWHVLHDVLILLTAAMLLGTLAEQLRQSAILGYLAAGTLVGPNVMGLVGNSDSVDTIAELGVSLLLFTIGLEFSFRRLKQLGRIALVGGSLQVTATLIVFAVVALIAGAGRGTALTLGAVAALSSTACVLRILVDRAEVDGLHGRNAVGILLFQDVAVIPLLVIVALLGGQGTMKEAGVEVVRTLSVMAVLISAFYLLVNVIVPRLLGRTEWVRNRELPILLAVVLALGSAAAAHRLDISPAIAAFIAGVLLGESPFAVQVRADVGSLKTLLVTLFFASIGMLAEPMWILGHLPLVMSAVILLVAVKTAAVAIVVRKLGFMPGVALATGLCLAQVGEFSFVIAHSANEQGILDEELFKLVIGVTLVTLFSTPFLIRLAPRAADWIEARRATKRGEALPVRDHDPVDEAEEPHDIFIIGFGPAGQTAAAALLNKYRERIQILDLNPRNAVAARHFGLAVHIGDTTSREVLEHAGVARAQAIIVTLPDPATSATVIAHCKSVAEHAPIIARARYHLRQWELKMAGAWETVDEEATTGLRLAAEARKHLRDTDPGTDADAGTAEHRPDADRPAS